MSHIVVFPLPVLGHITPMLHFAAAQASQGTLVTFITTKKSHAKALSLGAAYASEKLKFATIPEDDGVEPQAQQEETNGQDGIWQEIFIVYGLRNQFAGLMQSIHEEVSVTCLVCDFLMEWTSEIVEELGVPKASFWTASATFLLSLYYAPEIKAAGYIPLKAEVADEFIPQLEGLPRDLRCRNLPLTLHSEHPADPGFNISQTSIRNNFKSDWVLMSTCRELEPEAFDTISKLCKRAAAVGPLLKLTDSKTGTDPEEQNIVLKWLDGQKPASVLYVSFGSVAGLNSSEELEELVSGIECSKVPFVWVARTNLVEDCKAQAQIMKTFGERTVGRGIVVDWAPQFEVLRHSSVAGFLTHCGWNSVMESMSSGVPMLGLPCMADQSLNLWFVEKWGCGFGLSKVKCKEVAEDVIKLMASNLGRSNKIRGKIYSTQLKFQL